MYKRQKPIGDYHCSLQLLETELFKGMKIGIAGHPDGSPDISKLDLEKISKQNNELNFSINNTNRTVGEITAGKIEDNSRVISGSVLHGHESEGVMKYLGYYDSQVSVIPDEVNEIFLNFHMLLKLKICPYLLEQKKFLFLQLHEVQSLLFLHLSK